jgi:hypothetical protein
MGGVQLGLEVGALILINPLCNQLHLDSACFCDGCRVLGVWQSKVEMVSRLVDVQVGTVRANVEGDAASVPWVQITVAEHNVGHSLEVFGWMEAAIVSERPLELWP